MGDPITTAVVTTAPFFYGEKKKIDAAKDANKEQRKLDRINEEQYKIELKETIKRTKRYNLQTEGIAQAQAAGSGFSVGSSVSDYVSSIKSQQSRDLDWMKTSGASRVELMRRESDARFRISEQSRRANRTAGGIQVITQGVGLITPGGASGAAGSQSYAPAKRLPL